VLDLEYDLLMKSAWLDAEAYEATGAAVQREQLDRHADVVDGYVTGRFTVSNAGEPCTASRTAADVVERGGRAHARLTYRYDCPGSANVPHTVTSALFPDAESFVHSTETIVAYDLDGETGTVVLTAAEPALTTGDPRTWQRLGEFFVSGAEHMALGLDHVLFLLVLIVAARRLRDVVLVATAFTLAHTVTFLLASLGLVRAPAGLVEPVIAASIALVAGAQLWRQCRDEPVRLGPAPALDRAGWMRIGVVFAFGLVHGLGFAGALGMDEPVSGSLIASLVVFNLGIEAVQLAIIATTFPLLTMLRRRSPRAARWATASVAGVVALAGLVWVVQRVV
jgi:hypothetical protein